MTKVGKRSLKLNKFFMYPREFEDLLSAYLTDGVISDKERKVLLNKARTLGLDVEEIDLYIDAREQKIQLAANRTAPSPTKQKEKKCPFCGGMVSALEDKCPECGNLITPQASKELEEIIDMLEEALVNLKSGTNYEENKANVERYLRKASLYYGSHPKIKILVKEVGSEMEKAKKRGRLNQVKGWMMKNPRFMMFGVIMLIEAILYFTFSWMSDSLMYEYNNDRGSYADRDLAYSYESKASVCLTFLILTGIVAIVLYTKKRNQTEKPPKISSKFSN